MRDRILASWLQRQQADWDAFAPQTDLVTVTPYLAPPYGDPEFCQRYVAEFSCRGLARLPGGEVTEVDRFAVGVYFSEDHLRRIEPLRLVTLLAPDHVFHPNILFPALCTGHLRPGIGLIEILYQVHRILSYQHVNTADYLNSDAADWAREHRARFPIDRRPLKRRAIHMEVQEVSNYDLAL